MAGLSQPEVGSVLKTWEVRYRDQFPDLELAKWTTSMFGWLTEARNDTAKSARVRMRHLGETVNTALAAAWAEGRTSRRADGMDLYDTVVRLTVRGFTYAVVDVEIRPGPDRPQ